MNRGMVVRLVVLFGMTIGLVPAVVPSSQVQAREKSCETLLTGEKIKHIAKRVVEGSVDEEERNCYAGLAPEDKARVFEALAEERGTAGHSP